MIVATNGAFGAPVTVLGAVDIPSSGCPPDLSDAVLASAGLVAKATAHTLWLRSYDAIRTRISDLAKLPDLASYVDAPSRDFWNKTAGTFALQLQACGGGSSAGAGGFISKYKWPLIGGSVLLAAIVAWKFLK